MILNRPPEYNWGWEKKGTQLTLYMLNLLRKYKNIHIFLTEDKDLCILQPINNMAADDLAIQGARTSTTTKRVNNTLMTYTCTVMSLLEVPYLIEAPLNGPASCHKIVAPTQKNRTPRASNKNLREPKHKYIVQARHMLLKITMAARTTCFTGVGLHKLSCVSNTL